MLLLCLSVSPLCFLSVRPAPLTALFHILGRVSGTSFSSAPPKRPIDRQKSHHNATSTPQKAPKTAYSAQLTAQNRTTTPLFSFFVAVLPLFALKNHIFFDLAHKNGDGLGFGLPLPPFRKITPPLLVDRLRVPTGAGGGHGRHATDNSHDKQQESEQEQARNRYDRLQAIGRPQERQEQQARIRGNIIATRGNKRPYKRQEQIPIYRYLHNLTTDGTTVLYNNSISVCTTDGTDAPRLYYTTI